jgi:mono/diheme cytochrome c family protein
VVDERAPAMIARMYAALLAVALVTGCAHGDRSSAPSDAPGSSSDGGALYLMHCASCHQPDGRGMAGVFPPLAGDRVVAGDPGRVIAAVAFGTRGRTSTGGTTYDGVMPGWAADLNNDQIAAIVTYVRSAWHNHAPPVSAADVARIENSRANNAATYSHM